MKRRRTLILATAAAASFHIAPDLWAANKTWTFNGNGSWSESTKWLGGLPGAGDDAYIVSNNSTNRTVALDVTPPTLANLYIGNTGSGSNTLLQSGIFNLTTSSNFFIGYGNGGQGIVGQSGGTGNHFFLKVGHDLNSSGTYTLSGSATLNVLSETVGDSGTGTFIQSSGTHTIGSTLNVGYGSMGNYLLDNGSLAVSGSEYIGRTNLSESGSNSGSGIFEQSGGTHTVGSTLELAGSLDDTGTYLLNDGTLTSGSTYVGTTGSGTFNQSGGTYTVLGSLFIGGVSGSSSSAGIFLLSGSGSLVAVREYVGYFGQGTFNQSDGFNTVSGTLTIAAKPGSDGTYLFTGGTLITHGMINNGLFDQSGGSATVGNLDSGTAPAGTGVVNISGGDLSASRVRQNSLSISGTGSVTISAKVTPNDPAGTSVVESFSITDNGQLDLSNNSLIIDYTSLDSLLTDVRDDLQTGRLTSSLADTTHGLGYADNTTVKFTSFAGQTVGLSSLLIKYTYLGDANLDGLVDIRDLRMFLANFDSTNQVWTEGDFNYDGSVDRTDLALMARNWQAGVGAPLDEALRELGLTSDVIPEPFGFGGILALAWSLKRPRRRSAIIAR